MPVCGHKVNAIEIHDPDTTLSTRHVTVVDRVTSQLKVSDSMYAVSESMRGFPSSLFGELDRLQRELDVASDYQSFHHAFLAILVAETPANLVLWIS